MKVFMFVVQSRSKLDETWNSYSLCPGHIGTGYRPLSNTKVTGKTLYKIYFEEDMIYICEKTQPYTF